ncbi:hypothetical protein ID866_3580 [Astraeus odoratus]|nr:hypothetical protein ID866_3580 [Astraeus odoratus]
MDSDHATACNTKDAAFSSLLHPNRKWYNNRRLITSCAAGYDSSVVNGFQSLPQWQSAFNHPSGRTLGLLTAIQTASQTVGMFIGARYLLGLGITFAGTAAPLLISEIAYPNYRAQLTSLFNSLKYLGTIIAAWVTYGTFKFNSSWAWRLPSLFQGVPAVLQFALVLFSPESPRWLVSTGRDAQALQTLAYYHADGDEKDPLVQYEFRAIKDKIGSNHAVAASLGWKALIDTPGNRRRMYIIVAVPVFAAWSGNGLISYYLSRVLNEIGITQGSTQLLVNGLLQVWNLFWAVFASFMVERLGRRFLFLASTSLMTLFFMAQTICLAQYTKHGGVAAGQAFVCFVFLFSAAYDIAFTPLLVSYTIEILPFGLRAKGLNLFAFIYCLALVFNQYVNPIALDALGWKYFLVYVCWLAFEFIFLWFFVVETKKRTLEEIAVLFDGPMDTSDGMGQRPEA